MMDDDNSLSIALRRTPRRSSRKSTPAAETATESASAKTPSSKASCRTPGGQQTRGKKRVRFSDPGPDMEHDLTSTGLTPMVRRSTLNHLQDDDDDAAIAPSSKRRRHSTPVTRGASRRTQNTGSDRFDDDDETSLLDELHPTPTSISTTNRFNNMIRFPSLRHVLDDHVAKRRMRRSSRLMSEDAAEPKPAARSKKPRSTSRSRRTKAQLEEAEAAAEAELARLRADLAARDDEIERLQQQQQQQRQQEEKEEEETAAATASLMEQDDNSGVNYHDRVSELELEIEALRRELRSRSSSSGLPRPAASSSSPMRDDCPSSPTGFYDWTAAARDPFSDDTSMFMGGGPAHNHHNDNDVDKDDDETENFGDASMAELVCGTPSRRAIRSKAAALSLMTMDNDEGGRRTNPATAASSFPTPPATSSPTFPSTPMSMRRSRGGSSMGVARGADEDAMAIDDTSAIATPRSSRTRTQHQQQQHSGIQAALPDPEKEALELELESLRLELAKMTETLEAHVALKARLFEKLASASSSSELAMAGSRGNCMNDMELDTTGTEEATTETGNSSGTAAHPDLEARLTSLLTLLSDRTIALQTLNTSLLSLGFSSPANTTTTTTTITNSPPPSSAGPAEAPPPAPAPAEEDSLTIISHIRSLLRSARLELEYLDPGEIPLPLESRGAEVLDLLLDKIRALARRSREHESAIDEYHELELSLRQQLGDRCAALDELKRRSASSSTAAAEREQMERQHQRQTEEMQTQLSSRDAHIADLEVSVSRLRGAAAAYERDVAELERLVESMEREARELEEERGRAVAELEAGIERELGRRDGEIEGLEGLVRELRGKIELLERERGDGEERGEEEEKEEGRKQQQHQQRENQKTIANLNRAHGRALALRDARVAELRGEIDEVNDALRRAHATAMRLRVEKGKMERSAAEEKERAVGEVRRELEEVVARHAAAALAASAAAEGEKNANEQGEKSTAKDGGDETSSRRRVTRSSLLQAVEADVLERKKRRSRRRYDSGLGMMDDEDDQVDLVV